MDHFKKVFADFIMDPAVVNERARSIFDSFKWYASEKGFHHPNNCDEEVCDKCVVLLVPNIEDLPTDFRDFFFNAAKVSFLMDIYS